MYSKGDEYTKVGVVSDVHFSFMTPFLVFPSTKRGENARNMLSLMEKAW